ncbi:MAG: hypothetical protein ACFBWO_15675 [Paracoccaceae bacterium]
MRYEHEIGKAPVLQRIGCVNDLHDIRFTDEGLAQVEVPIDLVDALPLVGATRGPGPRLRAMVSLMRARGAVPGGPIVCRIGMKGRWVVTDGGHRITAVRMLAQEFWARLFGRRRIERLQFLLYTTPQSWSKLRPPQSPEVWQDPVI